MASSYHKYSQQKPKSTAKTIATGPAEKHAIVVAYWRDTDGTLYFLTGLESGYIEYTVKNEKTGASNTKTMREWPPASTNAKRDDLIRAEIEKINPKAHFVIRILEKQENTPTGKKVVRKEKYTLQIPKEESLRGFPKGGKNEKDKQNVGESDKDFMKKVAVREFKEEIGVQIPLDQLDYMFDTIYTIKGKPKHYFTYLYKVDDAKKKEILDSVKRLDDLKMGEVFDVQFEKASNIELNKKNYNYITNEVVKKVREDVGFRGGNRRRVTRKQRKSRNKTRRV